MQFNKYPNNFHISKPKINPAGKSEDEKSVIKERWRKRKREEAFHTIGVGEGTELSTDHFKKWEHAWPMKDPGYEW